MKGLGALVAAAVLVAGCASEQMVPFVPCQFHWDNDGPLLRDVPELAKSESYIYKMMAVLLSYGNDFEYRGGKLYIRHELATDRELLANYDNKTEWIRQELMNDGGPSSAPTEPSRSN